MQNGVMIAFLPTSGEWCKQPLPHLTLAYAGTIEDISLTSFNDLAKDALTVARQTGPLMLKVLGIEVFGDEEKVDVLRLEETPQLLAARELVEHWNVSEYDFAPHCTIGPEGSAEGYIPTRLFFQELIVTWGHRELRFRLGDY